MTQEEKQLLLIDLCARLPYYVKVKVWLKDGTTEEGPLDLEHNYGDVLQDAFYFGKIKDIKPYLRPMSSMTEEEKDEYNKTYDWDYGIQGTPFDWLNSHHFDYHGLIPKGLALEAPKDMYNFNNKEK